MLGLYSCKLGVLVNSAGEVTEVAGELLNLSGLFNFVVTAEHLIVRASTALVQIMFVFHAYIYALCLPVIKPQHSSLENIPKREMCLFLPWTLINFPKLVLISMSFNSESFQLTFKSGEGGKTEQNKPEL